jgi:hypothetical protein
MMIKMKYAFMLLLMVLLLSACNVEESNGCSPPSQGFSEADLVGTWSAIGSQGDNSFMIRRDGQYKQIMNVKRNGVKYESDWRPWRVTYSEQGLPYLHLEGFLMCAYWDQIDCNTGQTGIEPFTPGNTQDPYGTADFWQDICQEKWVSTPGEAVFIVARSPAPFVTSHGIMLAPFTRNPDEPSGPVFRLQEPATLTNTPAP